MKRSRPIIFAVLITSMLFALIFGACEDTHSKSVVSEPSVVGDTVAEPTSTLMPAKIPVPTNTKVHVLPLPTKPAMVLAKDFTLNGFAAIFPEDNGGEVSYQELDGVSLSDFRGKLVLVEFWASWCPVCADQMPQIEAAYRHYKERGLVVLGVEMGLEGPEAVRRFVEEKEITFPILLDWGKTTSLYEVFSIPTVFVVGPDGSIKDRFVGDGHNWNSAGAAGLIEKYLLHEDAR